MKVKEWQREALIRDLERLAADIPELIKAVQSGDQVKAQEALAVVTGASAKRFDFLMSRLTDYVLDEAKKGNKMPLQYLASGEAFS